jgi:hypothetical protein
VIELFVELTVLTSSGAEVAAKKKLFVMKQDDKLGMRVSPVDTNRDQNRDFSNVR